MVMLGSLGATLIALGIFLYLSHAQTSDMSESAHNGPRQVIANSRLIRLSIFIISNTLIATSSVFSVVSFLRKESILLMPNIKQQFYLFPSFFFLFFFPLK